MALRPLFLDHGGLQAALEAPAGAEDLRERVGKA